MTLNVRNRSSLPISNVTLQLQSLDGYLLADDLLEPLVIPLMNYDEQQSLTAVYEPQPASPRTGDDSHVLLYALLLLFSAGVLTWFGLSGKRSRRALGLLLCIACTGMALTPAPALAGDALNLDPASWPDKPVAFALRARSVSSGITRTVQVTNTVTVDGKEITFIAEVSFTFPGAADNLTDQVVDRGDLEALEAQGVIDVCYDGSGRPVFIDGDFIGQKVITCEDAAAVLNAAGGLFSPGFDAAAEDIVKQTMTDAGNRTENFFRYSPTVSGVKVLGSQIILAADDQGNVISLSNTYNSRIEDVDTVPDITSAAAITQAQKAFLAEDATKSLLVWMEQQRPGDTEAIRQQALLAVLGSETELLIYAADDAMDVALVYAVTIFTRTAEVEGGTPTEDTHILPNYAMTYYIRANDDQAGMVHSVISGQQTWHHVTVDCKDNLGVRRTINVQEQNGVYRMKDTLRSIETHKIEVLFSELSPSTGDYMIGRFAIPGPFVESFEFFGTRMNKKAVSLQANLAEVYDYYRYSLNRNSYDNRGATIIASMNWWFDQYGEDADKENRWVYNTNAAWCTDIQQFAFGAGADYQDCLDVVAHEFTHAVTHHVNDLIYESESGAMNEAYSDIMGNLVEGKTGSDRWLIGETVNITMRDMSDPSRYNQPEHYDDFDSAANVHSTSGIINFAAYKMMTDTRTRSITDLTWSQIYYDSMYRLPSDSTFLIMRNALICSAKKYGFDGNKQSAIKDAFDAVGVKEPQSVRIVLRWGKEPADLDSHLLGPGAVNASNRFHVYFGQTTYFADGTYHANNKISVADLDYDDVTSYGPEVTTIHTLNPGTYYFFVHDYTNGRSATSRAMAQSGANVEIHLSDGSTRHFTVKPDSQGTIWDVCRIDIDTEGHVTLTELNRYGTNTTCH